MPLMMVWPVASSSFQRKVGSSSASFASDSLSFSRSRIVSGSTDWLMTGS